MKNAVTLPPPLFEGAAAAAARDGMTVEAWLAARVRGILAEPPPLPPAPPLPPGEEDPLYADTSVFEDDGPTDTAERHDFYLYGPITRPEATGTDRGVEGDAGERP